MTDADLRKQFKEETGNDWINGDGEPDIDYVYWLEDRLTGMVDVQKYDIYSDYYGLHWEKSDDGEWMRAADLLQKNDKTKT